MQCSQFHSATTWSFCGEQQGDHYPRWVLQPVSRDAVGPSVPFIDVSGVGGFLWWFVRSPDRRGRCTAWLAAGLGDYVVQG